MIDDHYLTIGDLKKWIEDHNLPDDGKVYFEKCEDDNLIMIEIDNYEDINYFRIEWAYDMQKFKLALNVAKALYERR